MRRFAEILCVAVLAGVLVLQLLSYPVTEDPDPDGYVSYAHHLRETWTLPPYHRRLPGYPLFLAIVDAIGPGTMHEDSYWAQIGLYLVWMAALWLGVRRLLGPSVAPVFLGIAAGPSLSTRLSATLLSDAIAGGVAVLAAGALWLAVSRRWRWLVPLAGLGAVAYAAHPTTRAMLTLLVVGIAAAYALRRERVPVARLLAALAVLWGATTVVEQIADIGSARYNANALLNAGLLCLPPASDTDVDHQIEAAKRALTARLGYAAAELPPQSYPEMNAVLGPTPAVILRPLWYGRLQAHPLHQVGCAIGQARLRWHILVKQYAPFWSERRLVTVAYLPATGSPRSTLYRATGIELPMVDDATSWDGLRWPIALEIARVLATLVPLAVGCVLLARRLGTVALGVMLTAGLWCAALGLTHVLDARYLIPFAPGIALCQAAGLVALAGRLVRMMRTRRIPP